MVPEGWAEHTLGEVANIQVGRDLKESWYSPIETKTHCFPVYSNTVEHRGLYGFYEEAEYAPGSFTVVGRGIGLGTAFSRDHSYGAIGRLLVVSPKNSEFDSRYLTEYVNFILRIHNESGGIPQLPGSQFAKYKVVLPPITEQVKIAEILSTWDRAIETAEKLIESSERQKKALMQQLLAGKKRLLDNNDIGFDREWKRAELGSLVDYKQPTPYLVTSSKYSDAYEIPVLTAGKTFILGYTNESFGVYQDNLPAIIFDDFTTGSKYVDFPFKAKSSAMKILTAKKGVSIKFVYEAMQMLDFAVGGHQRHWISIYSSLVIPLPNQAEQQKIATVLTIADQQISFLHQKLNRLEQEKKALMQQLLTGKRRVKVDGDVDRIVQEAAAHG